MLDFLTTTDVGRMVPREGVGGEEDRGSEVSEGELREQAEVEEGGEESQRLFLPAPPFMASAEETG